MDLVDGVDAAVAGGGDGVSLDCILEVGFSGGSAPFRPRAELRAADMLALHLTPKVRTKHSDHCRHVRTVRPQGSAAQDRMVGVPGDGESRQGMK
jgi:hypothetical protein